MRWLRLLFLVAVSVVLAWASWPAAGKGGKMQLRSPSFTQMGAIPAEQTCEGADKAPGLEWDGVPDGVKSFVLIVDDPDAPDPAAPKRTWVHWVVYDIPANARSLAAGARALPPGAREGLNDWKQPGYRGPCPPVGRHRYFHKLYALDITLPEKPLTKPELEAAMKGHVLAQAELIGTYQKGDR
jgi:Raf kinase inhibitor-like YbhB/YbcL family protein